MLWKEDMYKIADLEAAKAGSFYTILGAGGELQDWIDGYEDHMAEQGIGKPTEWFLTSGGSINDFARPARREDNFPRDLAVLMFPLDGLNTGKLAMFKLVMEDRWFDDIVDNMGR